MRFSMIKNTSNVVVPMVRKHAVLTMGLPGSGKSYVVGKTFDISQFVVIDPDVIKQEQPSYNPKQPEVWHEWSKEEAYKRTHEAISHSRSLIVDGTGTNSEKMYKTIKDLQAVGYFVELLYVRTSLETALQRNAKRERNVPEYIVREKHELIGYSLDILSPIADRITIIDND